ncbi:MAG: hypothetical protein WBF43_07930 [Methylocella sp.]
MIRAALAFILCAVLGTAALAVSPSQNLIMELPHSRAPASPPPPPGKCPYAAAGFADGCAGAVAGTPQNPTLLKQYGANRPPWNVAGVDYAVGQSGPMLDPSVPGNLPACASYSPLAPQNFVFVNSVPCTLANLDFSKQGGICLYTSSTIPASGTLTLTNDYFYAGPNCSPNGGGLILIRDNINLVVTYSTLDSAYNPLIQGIIIKETNVGDVTLKYNSFLHTSTTTWSLGGSGTYTVKYNYAQGIGESPTHSDWFIVFGDPAGVAVNEAFNLVDSDPSGCCATALCYISPNHQGPLSGGCQNDVYITSVSTQPGAANGLGTVSLPVRIEPNGLAGPFTISNIYMDLAGVSVGYGLGASTSAGYAPPAVTCTGNKNLVTGAPITAVFGSGAAWMICH